MKEYGLLGRTLAHSFSKHYFEEKFQREGLHDCRYELFELPAIEQLDEWLKRHPELVGFTVTIPYKQTIIPFLDELDPVAKAIGAVNVVRIERKEGVRRLLGYNTDVVGFMQSLNGQENIPDHALVLGSGGAAAAIVYALREMGINYRQVSRTPRDGMLTYNDLDGSFLQAYPLIINCTPIGTMEDARPPIPYAELDERNYLYDLVYNPAVTSFMQAGIGRNARVQNGLQMLHLQADAAWELWNAL